jgi:hypothetical protein
MSAAAASRVGATPFSTRVATQLRRPFEVEVSGLKLPAAGMLAAGAALPMLGHPGGACPLRTLTGIPCPLCGMSTSVEDVVRLHLLDAIKANPMGIGAVAIALFVLFARRDFQIRVPGFVVYLTLFAMWVVQLVRFGIV